MPPVTPPCDGPLCTRAGMTGTGAHASGGGSPEQPHRDGRAAAVWPGRRSTRSAWTTSHPRASRAAGRPSSCSMRRGPWVRTPSYSSADLVLRPRDVEPGHEPRPAGPGRRAGAQARATPTRRGAVPAWPRPGSRAGSARSRPPAPRTARARPADASPRGARAIAVSSWAGVDQLVRRERCRPRLRARPAIQIALRSTSVRATLGDRDLADPGHVEVGEIGPMHLRDRAGGRLREVGTVTCGSRLGRPRPHSAPALGNEATVPAAPARQAARTSRLQLGGEPARTYTSRTTRTQRPAGRARVDLVLG